MPFELKIALRYLLAQRRQLFISVISTISTLGVVVGVMILLVALAILTGFQGELRSRILGAASHLSIYREGGTPSRTTAGLSRSSRPSTASRGRPRFSTERRWSRAGRAPDW